MIMKINKFKTPILQVGRGINGTGGGKVLIETSRVFKRLGYEVKIITDSTSPKLNDEFDVVTTWLGSYLEGWSPSSRFGLVLRRTLQLICFMFVGTLIANRYREAVIINHNIEIWGGDIIVLHNVFSAEFVKDKRPFLRKLIRCFHPVFIIRVLRERLMLRQKSISAIVAISKETLEEVKCYSNPSVYLRQIENGIDASMYRVPSIDERVKARMDRGSNCNNFVLLFVGHEFERKGLVYLIEALRFLPLDVHLWVVGGCDSLEKHRQFARKLGLEERVRFYGRQLNICEYYWAADVFVLPSAYETWALVGLEAMACGIPVLMTRVGGIREYLKDGKNGFFIGQDPADIAQKVLHLKNDETLLKSMGEMARETALQFSWDHVAQKYLELVHKVWEERKRGA